MAARSPALVIVPSATSGKAMASLILALLGITCLWLLGGIPAIIFGILARRDIRKSGGRISGDGLATAGIILGAISCVFSMAPLLAAISVPNFLEAQYRARIARARTDMRSLSIAIEAYYVDNSCYPPFAVGMNSVNGPFGSNHPAFSLPTFSLAQSENGRVTVPSLTSPVAYITGFPTDPLPKAAEKAVRAKPTFLYWCVGPNRRDTRDLYGPGRTVSGEGWILVSTGPDGDYDLAGEWDVYDPSQTQPSMQLIAGTNKKGFAFTYDPTNGTVSNGDMWRVRQ